MAYYFIDFENVNSGGLKGIEELSQEDVVLVLYSKKAHFLDVGCVSKILNRPLRIKFVEIQNGTPNALDFQLVVFATNAICQKQSDEYVIVTNDKGFDAAIAGWEMLYGVCVKRVPCIFAHRHTEVCTQCPPDGVENCEDVTNCPANLVSQLCEKKDLSKLLFPMDGTTKPPLTAEIIKKEVQKFCGFSPAKHQIPIILNAWGKAKSDKGSFLEELEKTSGSCSGLAKKKARKLGTAYDEWVREYS